MYVPSGARPAYEVKIIRRYGNRIELSIPFDALHQLLNDDEFGQAADTAAICRGLDIAR